ncbi:MAG TPA: peptidoglycan bridge formation glycyltransferase FemA/FemB family protein [candidate division Zixibacteria bacterium]|nr:peptidoglycan bridge formation glycyltransferase FemA/FemB family protein [candidate division Zixibacteria bacterium]
MAELRAWRASDRDAWNAFVESAPYRSFPQLWEWGELREPFGWVPLRIAVGDDPRRPPLAVAQVLLRRVPVLGWRLAYVPRGPVGHLDEAPVREALFAALRSLARTEQVATVKVDPEATPDSPFGAALLAPPWREATRVQPPRTRVVDLALSEQALTAALRRKHRQYARKAERAGVTVERLDGNIDAPTAQQALNDFYAIYTHTAERAGFVARARHYYERVWGLFAPRGHARLAFAVLDGQRVATLFHFTCGDRAAEAFGGMTDLGAESRANYLLKWRSILGFKAEGYAVYDMWGLATGGIAQFKEGFGGREVAYVGARDLPLRAAEDAALRVLLPAYGIAQRTRLRLMGRRLAGSEDG